LSESDHAIRQAMALHLTGDAAAHDGGRFDEIGRRFDAVERSLSHEKLAGELGTLRLALMFWDAWIDARNRGWQPTRDIQAAEWPALARGIAADLLADREITDPRVHASFDPKGAGGGSDRLRSVMARLQQREQEG